MMAKIQTASDEALVDEFRSTAQELGDVVINWLPGAPRIARRLFSIRDVLRERGEGSRLKLGVLLRDDDRFARYYAAQELYGLLPAQCRPIIEENTREFDAIAGAARSFLNAIDEGIYRPQ